MRRQLILGSLLLALLPVAPVAYAQVSLGLALPGLRIGINLPELPQLVRVPDSPAYYAPGVRGNYFYYEDRYWVYEQDNWYASTWYNGPWAEVGPEQVPLYVLRIPVRYYRAPPPYFRGWAAASPPRWGQHWGPGWQQQHQGWDRWDRRQNPAPAPLPTYQRPYRGERYPEPDRQQALHREQQEMRRQAPPEHAPRIESRPPARGNPGGNPGSNTGDNDRRDNRGDNRGDGRTDGRGEGRSDDRGERRGEDRGPDRKH